MNDKNVPTTLIEIIGANGSLGDWIISGWASDEAMIRALQLNYSQQMGAQMAQNIVSRLTAPQSVSAGGKTFKFTLAPDADLSSVFADAAPGDAFRLSGHGHSQGFSQPRAIAKSPNRRRSRSGNLHEQPAPLRRTDVLTNIRWMRAKRRNRPDARRHRCCKSCVIPAGSRLILAARWSPLDW